MSKNLVIVESPSKAKTISRFLGKDYDVVASMGHIRDLPPKRMGVNIEGNFEPSYIIPPDKKKVIKALKEKVSRAEKVYLATDEDREGEAIAWHLCDVLGLDSEKTSRIVFHEITKKAIEEALINPRIIDFHLVKAQQARRVLDRLVGFEISPVLWKKVKPALSAGRVQSVAVRLVVEREEEIRTFKPQASFKITGQFRPDNRDGSVFSADLSEKVPTAESAKKFLEACIGATFTVADVVKKPGIKNPPPPFITSTLQQEAARKLGFSVSRTMTVAQQLYEAGYITYMRTDSVNLSSFAIAAAKNLIIDTYGEAYSKPRNYKTKSKSAQEAHEAIRPSYLDKETIEGDRNQQQLYDLIRKRMIASQMAPAKVENTQVTIDISTRPEKFIAKGQVLIFDGFLKLYQESQEDESQEKLAMLPELTVNELLFLQEMQARQRFTKAPARYSEASLVRKLEELGIGRPSTYAPIISTIQKRKYVVIDNREGEERDIAVFTLKNGQVLESKETERYGVEKKKLFPTDMGNVVNAFLVKHFKDILDYGFTADIEVEFDRIAEGKEPWETMIRKFYGPFHENVEKTLKDAKKFKGERYLGKDPISGQDVFVKIGRYGPVAQLGQPNKDLKPRIVGLRDNQSLETITLEKALELFKLPREIGVYEEEPILANVGRFGPYLKHKNTFYALGKEDDPFSITPERAIECIEEKRAKEKNKIIKEFSEEQDLKILNGRYGPYISYKKKNTAIPRNMDAKSLTLEECHKLIKAGNQKKKR
ncbi:MAG: type I DNA topoisomerase [Candidatus Marinimicrobia bacterium]|nr:type I DNA topoisomerase [Candidatus Neomarinimicrobiota bacterium]